MKSTSKRAPVVTPAVAQVAQLVTRVFGPAEVVQIIRRRPDGGAA